MRTAALAAALFAFTAFADDVSPETVAKIRAEQKAATAAIDKKYEGKKLSGSERKAMAQEKNEAAQKVLDANKTDAKSFARASAGMGRDESAAADSAQKKIEKKAEEDAKAAEAKKADEGKGKEIVIEKGTGKKGKGGKGGAPSGYGPPPEEGTPEGDAAAAQAADREIKGK
jgi:hypothetical protein